MALHTIAARDIDPDSVPLEDQAAADCVIIEFYGER